MKQNEIKLTPKTNAVGDMYAKITGNSLIGQMMTAAGNGKINYQNLNPRNITVNVIGDSLTFDFDVDVKVMAYIMQNEEEWTLNILAVDDNIDFAIYQSAITNGEITYSDGHFTVTNEWIGADIDDVHDGTYNDCIVYLVNTGDDCTWENLVITVTA